MSEFDKIYDSLKELSKENLEVLDVLKKLEKLDAYKRIKKTTVLLNISAIMCLLSIAGMISSIVVFVWFTFVLSLKVFVTFFISYFIFWILNKSIKSILKQL